MNTFNLQTKFAEWNKQLNLYFDEMEKQVFALFPDADEEDPFSGFRTRTQPNYYESLHGDIFHKGQALTANLIAICGEVADVMDSSILVTEADKNDVSLCAKEIRAAIRLRDYSYSSIDVLHDEGRVLGIAPAHQREARPILPSTARDVSKRAVSKIQDVINLLAAASADKIAVDSQHERTTHSRVRANTAFIMMAIDKSKPELIDVVDAIKSVFKLFDITAKRADDIEHDGLITARVIEEIKTSEFLFADLTGERPNVYYEVGYAHALQRRVILFADKNTKLHFDLAGYNCPTYENLRDLRERLTNRLVEMTNRSPKDFDDS